MAKTTTIDEALNFLRVSFGSQNPSIQIMLDSAEEFVADQAGVTFKTDAELAVNVVEDNDGGAQYLFTNQKPLRNVVSIAPSSDPGTPIDADGYTTSGNSIRKTSNGAWYFGVNAHRITYTAGYGDTAEATKYPASAKHAILALVYRAYNNRGAKSSESGSGIAVNWASLLDSDISRLIASFGTRPRIF